MTPDTLHLTPNTHVGATTGSPSRLSVYARFVKLSHSLFSLPLLLAGARLAGAEAISLPLIAWMLLAGLGARTTGMTLNRIADRRIDAANPRTACRALPKGTMRLGEAWAIAAVGLLLYVVAASAISPLCLRLSPIPIALFAIYPYLKRCTALSHVGLGIAWATAPLGGWVAASGTTAVSAPERVVSLPHLATATAPLVWLTAFSILWVTGFDIIYATMDEAFDRSHGLHSLPARLGSRRALQVSAWLHLAAFGCLVALWLSLSAEATPGASAHWLSLKHPVGLVPLATAATLLVAEHRLRDRAVAFFPVNVLVGCAVLALVATAPERVVSYPRLASSSGIPVRGLPRPATTTAPS
jgi:4-hydroxybenzoate polyprenyltransferase